MKQFKFSQMCMVEIEIIIDDDDLKGAKQQLEYIIDDMPTVSTTARPIDNSISCEEFSYPEVTIKYTFDECCDEFEVMEVK